MKRSKRGIGWTKEEDKNEKCKESKSMKKLENCSSRTTGASR
jgi:hypothetical protein